MKFKIITLLIFLIILLFSHSTLLYAEDFQLIMDFKFDDITYSLTETNAHRVYDIDNPESDLNLRAIDSKTNKEISNISLKDKFYGTATYGQPKLHVSKDETGKVLIIIQLRHGGDGDHTENLLKLFSFHGKKLIKLLEQNIDSVEYVEKNGILKSIRGKTVETLCDVCDGWEVSAPEDIFFIPIRIDVKSLKVEAELSQAEKEKLFSTFEEQSKKNIAEQLSYGDKKYPAYVEGVKKRILGILN